MERESSLGGMNALPLFRRLFLMSCAISPFLVVTCHGKHGAWFLGS